MKSPRPFFRRLFALAKKETIHILRDVRVLYMALGMPVVLLILFGYAVTFDLDLLPIGLVDRDDTPASRELVEHFTSSKAFVVSGRYRSEAEIEPEMRKGNLRAALIIPEGYSRKLARGEQADAQLMLDGSDGTTSSIALGYSANIVIAESSQIAQKASPQLKLPLADRGLARFNPGMNSALFIVPGLIALILSILAVLLTALTVAREWERGSMEQLFATPTGRLEVILGKLAPYLVIGMIQVLLVLTLGTVLFNVPIRGSMFLLFGASLVFLTAMLAQGLFISVVTKNQQVATQIGVVSTMLPTMLLSGFLFPIDNMPRPLQLISHLVPSRYFIALLRGVMLKGAGLDSLWPQLAAMCIFAIVLIVASGLRFQRRLA